MQLMYVEDHDGASLVSLHGKIIYADEPESGCDNAQYSAFEVAENLAAAIAKFSGNKDYYYVKVFLSKEDSGGRILTFESMLNLAQLKLLNAGDMTCDGCAASKAEFIAHGCTRFCLKCFERDLQ